MKKLFPLGALALATATAVQAQTENKLEEVIVTSSRVEMPLRQVGTSVSVLTATDIQEQGFNSLADILRTQPAVAVSTNGSAGSITSLRIRGEEAFRTKVFIDGIDVSDVSTTQVGPRFEHILSSGINRVEILRGPQGLMYGADAGGIVNISTRSGGPGFDGSVSAEGGRYDTYQLGADLAGGTETVDFALSAVDFSSDGFNARTDDTVLRDDDGYDNTTVHGRVGWNAAEDLRLELVARDMTSDGEYDNCFGSEGRSDDCENEYDQTSWRVAADLVTGAFSHQLAYAQNETERQFYTDGLPAFGSEGELEKISYLGRFEGSDALSLVYGADLQTESMDDGFTEYERDQDGYYLEYQGNHLDNLYLTAGLRYDDNEDFGSHTTYRVSAAYIIPMGSGELKFKGAYGTGFRAPSLFEIVTNDSPFAFPPASEVELQEEESDGFDLGVVWANDDGLYLEATYFDQSVENEIFYDNEFFSGYLQGDGETESSGVELLADVPVMDSLLLTGNYTYNDTDQSTGGQRARRPEHLANLALQWRPMGERLMLAIAVRGSYDAVDTDGSSLDDYEVVNFNASFDVTDSLNLYGRVENLLDEDYEEVPNYNTPGAAAYAGIRYSF